MVCADGQRCLWLQTLDGLWSQGYQAGVSCLLCSRFDAGLGGSCGLAGAKHCIDCWLLFSAQADTVCSWRTLETTSLGSSLTLPTGG